MISTYQIHPVGDQVYVIIHSDAHDHVDFLHGLEGPFDNEYTARMWVDAQVRHSSDAFVEIPEGKKEEVW